MKPIISIELKKRLEKASQNGSVIARDILKELRGCNDVKKIIRKTVNYFDTIRVVGNCSEYKSLRIDITCCTKDISNEHFPDKGNPQAPYFKENREKVALSTFVEYFCNLRQYTDEELTYFNSAMRSNQKVTVKVYDKMSDFERAYMGINYSPYADSNTSNLHGSCMRYEDTARNAADFYKNFAGARIIIATDEDNNILGRAILWDKADFVEGAIHGVHSFLDRIYFCFDFVKVMIVNYATLLEITARKQKNTYEHKINT